MGIARDIFEIVDTGINDFEHNILRRIDRGGDGDTSLARKAADGTLQFPLLVSRTISFPTAQKIVTATETNAASFAQIVLTMNPEMDTSNDKGAVDYIHRFHTNVDTTDDVLGQFTHFVNSTDSHTESFRVITKVYHTNEDGLKVAKEELDAYGIDWRQGTLNKEVPGKLIKDNQFYKKYSSDEIRDIIHSNLETINEAKKFTGKGTKKAAGTEIDMVVQHRNGGPVSFVHLKPGDDFDKSIWLYSAIDPRNPEPGIEKLKKMGQKSGVTINIPDDINDIDYIQFKDVKNGKIPGTGNEIKKKDGKNSPVIINHGLSDEEKEQLKKTVAPGRQVVSRDLLMNNEVKKANQLAPTLLHIKVIARNKDKDADGAGYYVDFIIGIKATMHPIDSDEMINEITEACRYHDEVFRFIRWTTGEISFFSDFLLNLKDSRRAIDKEQGGGSPWWNRLHKMRVIANFKARVYMKNRMLPNVSIAISQQEVDYIKNNIGFDLMNPRFVKDVMDKYFLLCFIVVDESLEIVHFMYEGQNSYQTLSFSGLEKENADSAKNFREILKAVQHV